MARVRVDHVQEGMELGTDVVDRNGQVLVRAGTTISARELRLFKMWGIVDLEIAGLDDAEVEVTPDLDPALVAKVEPKARRLFQHTQVDHPFIKILFDECVRRLALGKARKSDHAA